MQQAGGENVYADAADAFVNVSVEDMLDRDPDVILRTSHALPDQVMEMFAQEFPRTTRGSTSVPCVRGASTTFRMSDSE